MRGTMKAVTLIIPVVLIGFVTVWLTGPRVIGGAEKAYQGTLYLAGMGGHIAKAEVRIDPAQPEPITILNLGRLTLASDPAVAKKAYAVHDMRIDHAKNVMFWSAFVTDGTSVRAGKVDLATGDVIADTQFPKDARTTAQGPMYCGSGQTKDKFLPVMMGYEGYIDVVDKGTMKLEKRVFFDHPKIPRSYVWAHGVSSPDGKEFALWMSLADTPGKFPREKEARHLVLILDQPSLVGGEIKVLREATLKSDPKSGVLFRGNYTSDGRQLLLSGRDRFWVLDAKTLKVSAETMNAAGWENHDIQPLPGDRYALLTQRVPIEIEPGKKVMDGQIELYDLTRKAKVGNAVSVCQACHKNVGLKTASVMCGIESVWKP